MQIRRENSAYDPLAAGARTSRWLVRLMLVLGILGMAYLRGGSLAYVAKVGLALVWASLLPFAYRGLSSGLRRQTQLGAWQGVLKVLLAALLLATFLLGAWILVVR